MDESILKTEFAGLGFSNPVGLAAGYDKNALAVRGLFALGFSAVEVGTITLNPQAGNPRPRMFLLREEGALINRLGFNNQGAVRIAKRLVALRRKALAGSLGVNIGPGVAQMDAPASALRELACTFASFADYLAVNLSSPNTEGLRGLQAEHHAREILLAVAEGIGACSLSVELPVFLKVSSDIGDDDLLGVVGLAREGLCAGLIIGNSTTARPVGLVGRHGGQSGGLSGRPLFGGSTERLAMAWRMGGGEVPLIGVGGVDGVESAWQKIIHGASLVQLYTGLVYQGPGLVRRIVCGLESKVREHGYENIHQAIGTAL